MKIIFKRGCKRRPGKGFARKFTLCIKQSKKVYYSKMGGLQGAFSRWGGGENPAKEDGAGGRVSGAEGKKKACSKAGRSVREMAPRVC